MPPENNKDNEDVLRKAFPDFDVVENTDRDDEFLPANSHTPPVKRLHARYRSDAASREASILKTAESPSSPSATHAKVLKKRDAGGKQLTVLVKQGKIKAVQG